MSEDQANLLTRVVGVVAFLAVAGLTIVAVRSVRCIPADEARRQSGVSVPAKAKKEIYAEAVMVYQGRAEDIYDQKTVLKDSGIAFRYRNMGPDPLHMVAFGLDQQGKIHWFVPNPRESGFVPQPIKVTKRGLALPAVVKFPVQMGEMRIVAVMSKEPQQKENVVGLLKGKNANDDLSGVFNAVLIEQWSVQLGGDAP